MGSSSTPRTYEEVFANVDPSLKGYMEGVTRLLMSTQRSVDAIREAMGDGNLPTDEENFDSIVKALSSDSTRPKKKRRKEVETLTDYLDEPVVFSSPYSEPEKPMTKSQKDREERVRARESRWKSS